MRRLALCLATVFVVAGCQSPDVKRFHDECDKLGGFVAETGSSFWIPRIDCIVDNHVVYLPGFA